MNTNSLKLDRYGFLENREAWDENLAHQLASLEGLILTTSHFQILSIARRHYQEFDIAPSMRLLVEYLRKDVGDSESINSVYIANLFPGKSLMLISKIAGLPKPARCT